MIFDDKPRSYTAPALRTETTFSFYNRSSLPEFAALRSMLERWAARLPSGKQKDIVNRMRHKGQGSGQNETSFNGALLELFLHEFLNGTGGSVTVEPVIENLTPDFGVVENQPNESAVEYVLEAADISTVRGTELEDNKNEQAVLDILDTIYCTDFRMDIVHTEGILTSMPSKQRLLKPFQDLAQSGDTTRIAKFEHRGWSISGRLRSIPEKRRPRKGRFVGIGIPKSGGIDDITKIKNILYAKAQKYNHIGNLIIAIRADWFATGMEEALFGREHIVYCQDTGGNLGGPLPPPRIEQKPDGFWYNTSGPQNQNTIGVVVFHNLHPHCIDKTTAVFYANPYGNNQLPRWANSIGHAVYRQGTVTITNGIPPCTYVKDHIPMQHPAHW